MPLRQTQLRVPEDEPEQARKVAAAKGISLSEYLRRALAVQLAYERAVEVQAATTAGWRRAAKRSANGAGATSPTAPNRDATAGCVAVRPTSTLRSRRIPHKWPGYKAWGIEQTSSRSATVATAAALLPERSEFALCRLAGSRPLRDRGSLERDAAMDTANSESGCSPPALSLA